MEFFVLVLIASLVLFLYKLYHLANDDYILIKKNIPLKEIFNSAVVILLISLFSSRIFYIVFNPEPIFLSPLGFLLFPYFPGLSLTGGVMGAVLVTFIYSKIKKFPTSRIFDFFAMSLIFVLPFGFLSYMILSSSLTIGAFIRLILYVFIFICFNFYLYPKSIQLEIKEGTKSILFLIFFSLISLLGNAVDNPGIAPFLSNKENFLLLGILFVSLMLLLKQEIIGRISFKNGK